MDLIRLASLFAKLFRAFGFVPERPSEVGNTTRGPALFPRSRVSGASFIMWQSYVIFGSYVTSRYVRTRDDGAISPFERFSGR